MCIRAASAKLFGATQQMRMGLIDICLLTIGDSLITPFEVLPQKIV